MSDIVLTNYMMLFHQTHRQLKMINLFWSFSSSFDWQDPSLSCSLCHLKSGSTCQYLLDSLWIWIITIIHKAVLWLDHYNLWFPSLVLHQRLLEKELLEPAHLCEPRREETVRIIFREVSCGIFCLQRCGFKREAFGKILIIVNTLLQWFIFQRVFIFIIFFDLHWK